MDWQSLIKSLCAAGMTQLEIGKAIGLSQPAVSDLLRGRTRRIEWSAGEVLRQLHAERCSGHHQEAA